MECFNGFVVCITVVFMMIILLQYERDTEEKGLGDENLTAFDAIIFFCSKGVFLL